MNVEETIQFIGFAEGLSVEEAVLTYKRRQALPAGAFCGPNKSYPAHDKAHVRNAFARLSTFGHRLKPAVRQRIHACLLRRAKRFGIEHKDCKWCKGGAKKVQETIEWFMGRHKEDFCSECNK